jgi:hypothetical protein
MRCWKIERERRQFLDTLRKAEVGGCLVALSGGMIELMATRRSVYVCIGKQGLVKVLGWRCWFLNFVFGV